MNKQASEYYELLLEIYASSESSIKDKYRQMRSLLERICRLSIQNEALQMTDLSARISYMAVAVGLDGSQQNRLHTFRITSNAVMNEREVGTAELLMRDIRTLAYTIKHLFSEPIPQPLFEVLPLTPFAKSAPVEVVAKRIKRVRVCFQYADDTYLYVVPENVAVDQPVKVRYNVSKKNVEFSDTVERLWQHAQLNLLDVEIDHEGVYTPTMIVLEPDYLIDISTLAECFKDYGHQPENYLLSKLQVSENTAPLLLGNVANFFLDQWIHAQGEVDYRECMQQAFRLYPLEFAACPALKDAAKEQEFFDNCFAHFNHIKEVVTSTFYESGYSLNKEDAVLEPSYICEALGLQGRLDYMQRDMHSFIEMKSGKADEYSVKGKVLPKENNKMQMLLYQAVLQYNMNMDHRKVKAYLLYTRYPLLYPSAPSWVQVSRAINLRNLIVATEHAIQLHNSPQYTAEVLSNITPQYLNQKKIKGVLWERYLAPTISSLNDALLRLTPLEQSYFLTLYNFITKEQYTSKSGDIDYDGRAGAAALWLSTLDEKREAGEILYDLTIKENHAADTHKAHVLFSIPTYKEEFLPNFRLGDVVLFYERNSVDDSVTNKMVFKGSIASISDKEIDIRIRASQQNPSVIPQASLYAIEHDVMDTAFKSMYQGLMLFAQANKERRDLLLGQRVPSFDDTMLEQINATHDDFMRIALKAVAAKDLFLLVGPPGTGKTSRALKQMVTSFYEMPQSNILLMAYTNRAVDEICKSISSIEPKIDFIRVGSELSCEEGYRTQLIENVLSDCKRRSEVNQRISSCRVFVGTLSSISNKSDLFRMRTFDVAIIDEATQILEPQLLNVMCVKNEAGGNAIRKFVLIGDHKQLPAVVLQNEMHSQVATPQLQEVGITNFRDSLFERLHRIYSQDPHCKVIDMLCKQGRMNPLVALFPNQAFYGGKLRPVGLPHQIDCSTPYGNRVQFIPSQPQLGGVSEKCNANEAQIAARLAVEIYQRSPHTFDASRHLGIITPYRSQIALIRKELAKTAIPALSDILVDTVERFQGSERDVIIYSFSVNHTWQLKFLSNIIEEGGVKIDRKLNVALTRARKQMYIIGAPELLRNNDIYRDFINLILPALP